MSQILTSDTLDLETCANDMVTIKNTLEVLARCYPGHPWAVRIDGGILEVKNNGAHGSMGFALHLNTVKDLDFNKKIMLAGGELLERFKIRRGIAQGDDYALMRRDVRGDGIAQL